MHAQRNAQGSSRSSLRTLRKVLNTGLPFVGVVVILSTLILVRELRLQIAIVAVGIMLIEVGVWKLANRILPSERQYDTLRTEVDKFITLVRQLNTAALVCHASDSVEHQTEFETIQRLMAQSVEHMAEVAGKTDAQVAEQQAELVSAGDS
ncbi:MAG: hypothetical protein O7G88_17520 [bacterium]|nr:hypothetical protein [bacterium]